MNKQVSYAYQHLSRTETLGKCIHGSMYLCPALLIALGKFEYYGSGGCQIGDSIDSHNRPFSVSAKYSCGFSYLLDSSIIVNER